LRPLASDVAVGDPSKVFEIPARRLAELEPEVICFGHGPVLRKPELFQGFVAGARVAEK
jgi:hypothetical protein